jgi:hypothetical protein
MEMYIVLAITLFMMVMFIWNKVPFGVTTMTCCLLLAMFGIVDIPKAFGGFGNKIVVLIAPMLVLSAALGKTSLVMKISSVLNAAKGPDSCFLCSRHGNGSVYPDNRSNLHSGYFPVNPGQCRRYYTEASASSASWCYGRM